MTVRIDGTNSTANPAITGADTDTGLQFGTDEVKVVTGGTDAITLNSTGLTIDSSVGIGTSSVDFSDFGSATNGVAIEDIGGTNTGLKISDGSNDNYLVAAGNGNFYQSHYGTGSMIFGVGDGTGTERMRILSSGGITFNGDTAATNALDDYEEGTFDPTIYGGTTAGTVTYVNRHGQYVKVGHLVHVQVYLHWNSGTGTGTLRVGNLPFNVNDANTSYAGAAIGYWHLISTDSDHNPILFLSHNNNFIHCYQYPHGSSASTKTIPYAASGGGLIFSATYRAE